MKLEDAPKLLMGGVAGVGDWNRYVHPMAAPIHRRDAELKY